VETAGLVRTFGDVRAVDGLDLEVARGDFFGFLGPNGAGKSTTLKILTGLLDPTAGSARILGFDVAANPREAKARIGVVPEELMLFDRLSAGEYLELVGRLYDMPRPQIARRSEELLEVLGLADAGSRLIVDYSHGMQKKLSLAAAILHDPEVLFLDEPFEGIDAVAARLIKNILNRLRERGVTIFLTSHILEIVERLCSEIAIIDHGRLVACGTLEELRGGLPGHDGVPRTLEELFLSVVGTDEHNGGELSWIE